MKQIFLMLAFLACASVEAKTEVVCVYYPHWHRYDKGDEWFGADKWAQGEWCFVKDAKVLFPGQKHPLIPYAGYLDESNPKDMEKDIALAANAGIDVFLYDYYYYDGKITQEAALEKGFLGAKNRNRMKFALMWCYHDRVDQFRPDLGKERRRLMPLAQTKEEFLGLIDLSIKRYFARPEYWRKDGKLFFSIYNFYWFYKAHGDSPERVKAELDEARAMVRKAGLGELHINVQGLQPEQLEMAAACGVDSVTDYVYDVNSLIPAKTTAAMRAAGIWQADYASAVPYAQDRWESMSKGKIPYFPQVFVGWDSTPRCQFTEKYPWRCQEYPYTMSFTNNTPDIFGRMLAKAKLFTERKGSNVVYINGWNEYTEGTYLVPNNFDADGFLRAIASVFGRKPENEYTYINPYTHELMTVPAATYENLAYGRHPKQKVDVWLPTNTKEPTPMIIYMHGGGWDSGAMVDKIVGTQLKAILDRGVAVACVGYRYISDIERKVGVPPVKGCIDDAENAIAFLKSRALEWRVDASRIGLAGGSAGACSAMILAYRDDNALGIKALAPIIPQTSLDPVETREWIPNAWYGAHAFGYANMEEWIAHRDEQLVATYSPAALARKINPAKAPLVIMRAKKPNGKPKDPTHATIFCWKFADICHSRNLPCDIAQDGDSLLDLANALKQ